MVTGSRLILIAEDDPTLAALYRRVFRNDRLVIVDHASAVIQSLRADPPDVLILDYGLRDSTAEDVIAGIHGELPPTVVVSADPRAQALARRIGAPLLRKPFDIDDLEIVMVGATNR